MVSKQHIPRKQRSITTWWCGDIQVECGTNFNTQ